jgi:hypothetical protein
MGRNSRVLQFFIAMTKYISKNLIDNGPKFSTILWRVYLIS